MRVSLRTKLSLAFAAVVAIPVGVTLWRTRESMTALFRADFETRVSATTDALAQLYADLGRDMDAALAGLGGAVGSGDSPGEAYNPLDKLLLAMRSGGLDPELRRDFADYLPGLMSTARLDVLSVLDAGGTIIACGHNPGRAGNAEPETLARARAFEGKTFVVEEDFFRRKGLESALTVQLARRVERHGIAVVVIAGRILDRRLLGALGLGAGAAVTLTDAAGKVIATTTPAGRSTADWPFGTREIRNPDGTVAARLVVAVDDANLERSLERVTSAASLVAIVGTALALLLALVLAGRIARPLGELARAAGEVAKGKLRATGLRARSRDEVGDLVRAFDDMTAQLEQSRGELRRAERVAAWREVAQRIAHEIKNPLSPIRTSVETLRKARAKDRPDFDEIFEESTATVLEEVERLRRIVDEFSRFARLPAPQLAPVDVLDLARSTAALYAPSAEGVQVEVVAEGEPLPATRADREQLTQVLHNLLKNAGEAMGGAGRVTVRLRHAPGGGVEMRVADTGPGVPAAARDQLFVPYFTTKSDGTGLGLAICHRIVTEHGGRLSYDPGGAGATFVITLPE